MPVSPPDVAPTPSPPPSKARPSSSHVNAPGPSLVPASPPSPSSVDARGPSLVPTSTPSSSPPMGNFPIDEHAANLAMEDPALNNRPMRKLVWRPEEENEIQKAFNSKTSHILSKMFRDARNENKRPYWIGDRVWNDLLSHWNAPEYRSKCAQAKKNRASEKGGCMHTGRSISLQDHAIRLSEELGRFVYVDEVFQQTHLRKDTGQFVDDRSRQTHARLSQARSDAASSIGESQLTPLDPAEEQRLRSRCWVAAARPKCKGRLYGIGDLAHTYKCGSDRFMQHTQGSFGHAEDAAEINRLREELRQSKEEMHVFQSVVLQFLPPEVWNIINQQQQTHQQHQDHHQDQADDQQTDDQ
ncbi:hypothetical protein JHK86_012183 [Glycine max]|nr:hypothetical protein JHK86_012183 [Glycine max]